MQKHRGRGSYCKPATIPSSPRACPPWQVSQFTTKKKRSDLVGTPLLVQGVGETYGFACVCGCVVASCFFWWIFFDAWFCSWLTCFFSAVVSLPPLALRSAATCLLMPFCCLSSFAFSAAVSLPPLAARSALVSPLMAASFFSRFAVSPAVSCPLFTPCAIGSCWFSLRCATVGLGLAAGVAGVAAVAELPLCACGAGCELGA